MPTTIAEVDHKTHRSHLRHRQRRGRDAAWTSFALSVLTVILLTATAPNIGLTWDEPAYIVASESYLAWLGQLFTHPGYALSAAGVRRYWEPNHEHPPLGKIWTGLVWSAARFAFDDPTAHRLGSILLSGALVGLLYAIVAAEVGHVAGLAAAAALITMPRFFFHAHLAALDVPVTFAAFVVVYLFWRTAERRGLGYDLGLGLAWGLALATKVNAVFVPPALLLWTLLFQRRAYLFRRLIVMGAIGAPLSLLLWPWLYLEFPDWVAWYLRWLTVDHWEIDQYYLGRLYAPPPWHFVFVMTVAVVPLTLTLLSVVGVARSVFQRNRRATGGLYLICALMPMLILATGWSTVYDNERLFMPAFPYLAALAGLGFDWASYGLRRALCSLFQPGVLRRLSAPLGILLFLPHVVLASRLYPHLLSYYSQMVGGLRGAVRLGLETTYWSETYAAALPYLNAHTQPGDVIWVQEWSHDVMLYYQLQGQLRPDLRIAWLEGSGTVFAHRGVLGCPVPMEEADYVVIQRRESGFDDAIRAWLGDRKPVYQLSRQGVPLMEIYAR